MELGLFQPSWEKQVSETETISANEPSWGFVQTPQTLGFFRKNRKLLKIDRNGLSNWTLCSKLQQFRFKVYQAERNRCDSTGNPWAFVFSFRTESICASRQRSYVPRPPPYNHRLFLDFGEIFSGQHDSPSNLAESWYHQHTTFWARMQLQGWRSGRKQVAPR